MRNNLFTLLIIISISLSLTARAQTDNENIMHAKSALDTSKKCDDALRALDKMSADGKNSADYFLCAGRAHDCKSHNAQAIYYYNKYLELQPANDSVKKRVAELTDQKTEQTVVASKEATINNIYQYSSKKKKRKKHKNISSNYSLISATYGMGLGGADAPYKKGIDFEFSGNYPIVHDRVTLGYSLNTGFLFSPNTNWFSNVFAVPVSSVSGVNTGYSESLSFIPMAVLVNTRKISLSAGPEIGIGLFYTPEPENSFGGAVTFNDDADFGISYGLRSNLLIGSALGFFIEYTTFSVKSVSTEYGGVTQSIPVNHDMLKISISYRFDNRYWGWW